MADSGYGLEPSGPVPTFDPADSEWEDETDDEQEKTENALFDHFMHPRNSQSRQHHAQYKNPKGYKERLQTERKNWEDQKVQLLEAYMEWKVHGPALETAEEGTSSFQCKIFDITGEITEYPPLSSLITIQATLLHRSITRPVIMRLLPSSGQDISLPHP